jgi:hypothetical protein
MRLAILLLAGVLLVACSGMPAPAVESASPLPALALPSPTISAPTSAPTETVSLDFVPAHYELRVNFDYANHFLRVDETVLYTNNSQDEMDSLFFVVEAHRSDAGFELIDVRTPQASRETANLDGGGLQIFLGEPLLPSQMIELELFFELYLPHAAGLLGWTERQTNFVDWFPYIPPYESEQGWVSHEPGVVGEHGVYESANFDVHIEVQNAPASLSLATPAVGIQNGDGWDYRLHGARRFVWSASGQYQQLHSQQGGVPISIYFFEEQRDAAEAALRVAEEALGVYTEMFGPYPYESLSIVEAQFPDGMESDGLFFLDQYFFQAYSYDRKNYLTALTAHEIAHNWWFGQVGNDQAMEPWLDEALCIYSELLYYEHISPDLADWWWNFRIDRFYPEGWVNSTIYDFTDFSPYVHAVYMRGALFLRELRAALGDDTFFVFLRDWAEQGTGEIRSTDDFFAMLQQFSSSELNMIIDQYFVQP